MILSYILIIIGFLLLIGGLAGCFLPVLPGPPLSYGGLLLIHFIDYAHFMQNFLLLWAAVTIGVTLLDYYVPLYGSKKFGGSKYGFIGASIGMLVGIFAFPPFGIIIGPLIGAFLGEIFSGKHKNALKSALGTFVGFLFGLLLKVIVSVMLLYYSIAELI